MAEKSLADIDFSSMLAGKHFFPSPVAWEDEVLYFLMLDRFSDGREMNYVGNDGSVVTVGSTPPFQPGDAGGAARDPVPCGRLEDPRLGLDGDDEAVVVAAVGAVDRHAALAVALDETGDDVLGLRRGRAAFEPEA